jgi:type II secretory pathway pseudopilin PulG
MVEASPAGFRNASRRGGRKGVLTMRVLRVLCFVLMVPGFLWAQASRQKTDSPTNDSDVAAELKAVREALSQTQKQMASQEQALREALSQTQQQMATQQQEIEALKSQSRAEQTASVGNEQPARLVDVSAPATVSSNLGSVDSGVHGTGTQAEGQKSDSPLSYKIGSADIRLGGFVDIENIFRTTNTQNNIATNFAAIPFSNTTQGQLSEYRLTAQFSRFSIQVTDKFGANDVNAYCEADFSGNDATNVYQTVNGHTLRMRLCFMDLKRGKWEILGGQTWSWLTPNRSGLGPRPADLAITYNEDQNIGVGLPYTRAAEFRIAYHLNDHLAFGVGIEDPNQFIGTFVALPSAFASAVGTQFDNGSQIGTPNLFPDIIPKIAYDTKIAGRHFHLEAVGLVTGVRSTVKPIGDTTFASHSSVGGGGSIASNFALFRNFLLLGNAFWSDGGARYLVADGPQLVIRPNVAGTDISPSLVHAGAGSVGFEWIADRRSTFAVYYGADYFGRNFFPDTTNTTTPGTIIGYGGPGSPNTNNRAIQQVTFDWLQTFWKSNTHGALQYYTQYSYLTRAPWFVAPDSPRNAHLSMVYAGIRYVLPSTSGFVLREPNPESK